MLHIKLPFPVILRSSLAETARILDEPLEEIKKVWGYEQYIDTDENKKTIYLSEKDIAEKMTDKDFNGFNECRLGSEGILWLATDKEKSTKIPALSEIDIPMDIYYEDHTDWDDICALCATIESRVKRLEKLMEINAPEIIIRNEKRMLTERVSALADNSSYKYKWSDGTYIKSLKDLEFSLITGTWEKQKQERLDKELLKWAETMRTDKEKMPEEQ